MRLDLPTQPDDLYTRGDICRFDRHRNAYRQTAAIGQRLSSDFVLVPDDEAAEAAQASGCKGIMHLIQRQKPLVTLGRVRPTGTRTWVPQRGDIITALYFPTNLAWVQIEVGGETVGEWAGQPKSLAVILDEARTLPKPQTDLADLLALARCGGNMGYVHMRGQTIVLEGIEYTRLEPLQPFVPLIQLQYSGIIVTTPEPCVFWVEGAQLDTDDRNKLAQIDTQAAVFFVEGQRWGLFKTMDGMGGLKYSPLDPLQWREAISHPVPPAGPNIPPPSCDHGAFSSLI
jgi:hypothetical protein